MAQEAVGHRRVSSVLAGGCHWKRIGFPAQCQPGHRMSMLASTTMHATPGPGWGNNLVPLPPGAHPLMTSHLLNGTWIKVSIPAMPAALSSLGWPSWCSQRATSS